MAKMKKKSSIVKNASKKTTAVKKTAKTSIKHIAKPGAAKKIAVKSTAKLSAKDAKHKKSGTTKTTAPKPIKVSEKIAKKVLIPAKEKIKASATAKKTPTLPIKSEKKVLEKETKKTLSEPVMLKSTAKKEAKAVAPKKGSKSKKEETEEVEDDFVADDDFVGADEIGEYEEELKAVEELDEEVIEDEAWAMEVKDRGDEEVFLTDAEGRRYCRSRDCDQVGAVDGYCRYHYLLFWRKIQVRKKILADGKLGRYIEELTARFPDKFLEMIRRDLRTEKDFLAAIQELEIDESSGENELEEETTAYIEEVRGIGEGSSTGVDDEEF